MVQNTESTIKDESESRTSLSDLEDSPLNGEVYLKRKRNWNTSIPWPSNESPIWKYWSLLASVCCIILLATTFFYKNEQSRMGIESLQSTSSSPLMGYPHPVETWKKENLIETKYYRDLRYMTLDHESDYLWQEHLFMSTGNIRVPGEDGNTSLMSISMYRSTLSINRNEKRRRNVG